MPFCSACGESLPAEGRFCPACGVPLEAKVPTEERKLATVVFADLVGSTELGGAQDPERTRALLDRFYEAMAAEIEATGGTVEKFAGDAVMAAFGAPAAHEDDAERALHAALAMQRRLHELFGETLALRIGVNTGEVVVGRAREGSSFVSGDAVNVAARLEQAAAPGEVLAGERTVAAARGAFEFAEPTTVEAKGKPGGVACRRLMRALSLMRPRGVSGLRRAFVGRDRELDLLQSRYHRVVSEQAPGLVTIVGDAGVGKTRLVREVWDWLGTQSPEPGRRTGRCLPYGQGIMYWPLGEVLREQFHLLESDPPEIVRRRLGEREILGLTLGLDVARDLHPLTARDRLHDAWVELLDELAAERPVVVLIEDLHWAEKPLVELLQWLLRSVGGPVFLIATARPELLDSHPGWGAARQDAELLTLEPLSPDDSARLLADLLASELPAGLRELVVARAEGNPFFVEELLAMLIDRGVLEKANGDWAARDLPAGFAVPDSVQAVLTARIDLLSPAEKAALQAASVIGRIFWTGAVYELMPGLEPDFAVLEERDFVRPRPGSSMAGQREYAIKHALTREVAYASLPKAKRARLHAAFAGWLERAGEARDEHASLLAHHYAEAVRPEDADLAWADAEDEVGWLKEKAIAWLRRAAELAVGRGEIDEALAMLHDALELESDRGRQAGLWRAVGRANALKFDGEAFWTAMHEAISRTDDREALANLYSELGFDTAGRSGMWRRLPERTLVDGWIDRALELSSPESHARARALIARCYWDEKKSAAMAAEASALAELLGDVELRSYALDARVVTAFGGNRFDDAHNWAQRRLDLAPEINDPDHLADIFATMVPAAVATGRVREARRLALRHDEVSTGLSAHHRVHGVAVLLEVEEIAAGWERMRELTARAEETVAANSDTPCVRNPRSLLVCALASAQLGDDEAARRLERAADEIEPEGYENVLAAPRVRLALARGDLERVQELVAKPFAPLRQYWFFNAAAAAELDGLVAIGDRERVEAEATPLVRPRTYLEPFAKRALGVVREDESLIEQAAARFEAMGLHWHAAQTRALR